jgi:hypothetical protein
MRASDSAESWGPSKLLVRLTPSSESWPTRYRLRLVSGLHQLISELANIEPSHIVLLYVLPQTATREEALPMEPRYSAVDASTTFIATSARVEQRPWKT